MEPRQLESPVQEKDSKIICVRTFVSMRINLDMNRIIGGLLVFLYTMVSRSFVLRPKTPKDITPTYKWKGVLRVLPPKGSGDPSPKEFFSS